MVEDIHLSEEESSRLAAMGLCRGHLVELLRPGDPMLIEVLGTRIALSTALADRILTRPSHHADGSLPKPAPFHMT